MFPACRTTLLPYHENQHVNDERGNAFTDTSVVVLLLAILFFAVVYALLLVVLQENKLAHVQPVVSPLAQAHDAVRQPAEFRCISLCPY